VPHAALLAARLDELAAALDRAGAPADAASRLLELASVASMKAVALDHARTTVLSARPARPAEAPLARAA
jgi:hypothetical protein